MYLLPIAPLLFFTVALADPSVDPPACAPVPDDGIGPITVTVTSNVLTVKFVAPTGKYNLVSFHMNVGGQIAVPDQGAVASPNLAAGQDYKDGAWVWSGPVLGKTEADLKGKQLCYWVRVEESGLGKNGIPKCTPIN